MHQLLDSNSSDISSEWKGPLFPQLIGPSNSVWHQKYSTTAILQQPFVETWWRRQALEPAGREPRNVNNKSTGLDMGYAPKTGKRYWMDEKKY